MAERKLSDEELDEMIADATVDAYGDYEEFMSIVCHLDSNMVFPFKAAEWIEMLHYWIEKF